MASTTIEKSKNYNDSFRQYVNSDGLRVLVWVNSFNDRILSKSLSDKLKKEQKFLIHAEFRNDAYTKLNPELKKELTKINGNLSKPFKVSQKQINSFGKDKRMIYAWYNSNEKVLDKYAKELFSKLKSPSSNLRKKLRKIEGIATPSDYK